MEKVSDFFSELKERISNPLILSFLIAWCCHNYQILVTIIFYKIEDLRRDNYRSYLAVIQSRESLTHFLYIPLGFAIAYTVLFPFLKIAIIAFGLKIDAIGAGWNRRISSDRPVSMDRFLEEQKKVKDALDSVETFIKEEASLTSTIAELRVSVAEGERALQQNTLKNEEDKEILNKKLDMWTNLQSPNIINGNWRLIETDRRTHLPISFHNITINGNRMSWLEDGQTVSKNYTINGLANNPQFLGLSFSPVEDDDPTANYLWFLEWSDSGITLRGSNRYDQDVELRRQSTSQQL